jgi:hypothetical protein
MSQPGEGPFARSDAERHTFKSICGLGRHDLETLFICGTTPRLREVLGWEYRGRNISLVSAMLRIRRFIKGFLKPLTDTDPPGIAAGYNLWARQSDETRDNNWIPILKDGKPLRHGFYGICRVRPDAADNKYPHAFLLDYSLGRNPWYYPGRFLRDYVVQVYPDDPRLLIGKAYVALGSVRLFGGYFVMERAARNDPPA